MIDPTELYTAPRTAAEWFAARQVRRDAEIERRFQRWIAADPRNADEYALCDLTWQLSADAVAGLEPEHPARYWRRRSVLAGLAVAASAAIVALALHFTKPPTTLRLTTLPGEQRIVMLDDGSQVTLNTRSTLDVRIDRREREIRMLGGEAFFVVAKDAARPFVVATPLGSARAVGTRFNVFLAGDRVEVSTEEGQVLVQTGDESGAVLATQGTRVTLVKGAIQPTLDAADLARIENWRAQRLEFDRVPLTDALAEISRYTALPIRAGSAEIGRTEISAVLRIGDVDALRATLHGAFGLELEPIGNEWVVSEPGHAGGETQIEPTR
jgi:transmembrane sensor